MEFKFENKEIEELTRKMEEAKKEYLLAIHNLAFAISRDSNDLILIRKSETKKQKRGELEMEIKCTVDEFKELMKKEPHRSEAQYQDELEKILKDEKAMETFKSFLFNENFFQDSE